MHLTSLRSCGKLHHALKMTMAQVEGRERKRFPPHPLSTLELQKKATGILRLPGERIMHLAEELYQAGFISYPRTETDAFDQLDLTVGSYAAQHELICGGIMHVAEQLCQAGTSPTCARRLTSLTSSTSR